MARRPALIKLKQKATKKSKAEQYIINRKYCGDEPTFTSKPVSSSRYSECLSWYNYMCEPREAREYLTTYLKNSARFTEAKKFKSVPDKWVHPTVCWIARMLSRGAKLQETSSEFFESRLKDMLDRDYSKSDKMEASTPEGAAPVKKVEKSIQDRMATILDGLISEIEEKIDEFVSSWEPNFEMYTWLQGNEVPAVQARRIHDYYNPQLLEIEEAYNGIVKKNKIDDQLKEGYETYGKDKLTKLYGFFVMIVEDLEQYINNSKKERKPRAKKPMSAEKKLKNFKYLEFDNTNKIQSVQPIRIFGASELWAFNTKYNQLTVFRSTSPNGLDVHRTSIINFDPSTSQTKKLRAKDVDAVLKELQSAGKVALRSIMKNARGSDQKLQERMNENTVLVRVVS